MLCWQDIVYTEVCDPRDVSARPLRPARHAGLHPPRADVAADDPARVRRPHAVGPTSRTPCGRTYPRLPQGIFGRIDDMFTIRGENVYPSEIDAALNAAARLRRRASHRHHAAKARWTSSCSGSRPMRRPCAEGATTHCGVPRDETARTAAEDARPALRSRDRRAGHVPAHRLQGAARHRRPRSVPRHERAAGSARP